jgi:hypothetical protein
VATTSKFNISTTTYPISIPTSPSNPNCNLKMPDGYSSWEIVPLSDFFTRSQGSPAAVQNERAPSVVNGSSAVNSPSVSTAQFSVYDDSESCYLIPRPSSAASATSSEHIRRYIASPAAPSTATCLPLHVPFERSIDVFVTGPNYSTPFQDWFDNLPSYPESLREAANTLARLSSDIRRHIISHVLPQPDERRKVTLAPDFAISQFYPEDYFLDPFWDILQHAEALMLTSKQLRDDVQTYFWTAYHFHISLSSFTSPNLSKLIMQWLPLYADRIQHLSIELDFTRLGLSNRASASLLATGADKVRNLLEDLVQSLGRRSGRTMAEIHLMCRRYAGSRPSTHSSSGQSVRGG